MNKIYLHGALGEQFGPVHSYLVDSPKEAIRALCVNHSGFAEAVAQMELKVIRSKPGIEDGMDLDETELGITMANAELHVVPYPTGSSGGKGIGKIILGIVLIGTAMITGGLSLSLGGLVGAFTAGGMTGFTALLGASMILGGVAMMLAPAPPKSAQEKNSFLFSGATNVTEQGHPVPIVYGLTLTGSVIIGLGLDDEQVAIATGNTFDGRFPFGGVFGAIGAAIFSQIDGTANGTPKITVVRTGG